MAAVLLAVVAFVAMEAVTYGYHRWVMHGPGLRLHRSHHRRGGGGWEANDAFPLLSAAATMGLLALGFNVGALSALVPVGVGVTAYGVAYLFVHEVYIHGRLPRPARRFAALERLKDAHRVHHVLGGEPYGMLLPVVPATLRRRATAVAYDPFPPARGSEASHVPSEA
jgi:beta-carotene 3-hydroxylase